MRKRILAVAVVGAAIAALTVPAAAAAAAQDKTDLAYSIKDARAFLWQIHYPQTTFISEKYAPCHPGDAPPTLGAIPNPRDHYQCDPTQDNQTPGTCKTQARGRRQEAGGAPPPPAG